MPQFREIFHQSLAVMTVGFNELCAGMGVGWTAPTLNKLHQTNTFSLTTEEFSWIASVEHFGKVLGVFLSALFLDVSGRKPLLALSALIFSLTWLIILFTNSVLMICVMRIVYGIACGIEAGTNSFYIGENSSPIIRATLGTIIVALYYGGMSMEFAFATYFSYHTTAIINASVQFLLFLASYWMREPAQFLLMRGKPKQALENFMWLKGVTDPNDVKNEFEKIKLNVQTENLKKSSLRATITTPANYKSVVIITIIYILTGATGYTTIMSYASLAFSSSNILTPNEFTILFGLAQLVVVVGTSFIINRFDRRSLILISFSAIAFIHACTALLYYVQDNLFRLTYFPWLIFCSITLYAAIYAVAYTAVFLIRGELFPLSIRAIGGCASITGFSLVNFFTAKIFLFVHKFYGIYMNFVLFSTFSLILVVFVYLVLPETRNKTLVEIQEAFEKKK